MMVLDVWDVISIMIAVAYLICPIDFVPGFIGDDVVVGAVIYFINKHRRKRLK